MEQIRVKIKFFEFIEKLWSQIFTHCLGSIVKVYIICNISAKVSYLKKDWILKYWSKCSEPIELENF